MNKIQKNSYEAKSLQKQCCLKKRISGEYNFSSILKIKGDTFGNSVGGLSLSVYPILLIGPPPPKKTKKNKQTHTLSSFLFFSCNTQWKFMGDLPPPLPHRCVKILCHDSSITFEYNSRIKHNETDTFLYFLKNNKLHFDMFSPLKDL